MLTRAWKGAGWFLTCALHLCVYFFVLVLPGASNVPNNCWLCRTTCTTSKLHRIACLCWLAFLHDVTAMQKSQTRASLDRKSVAELWHMFAEKKKRCLCKIRNAKFQSIWRHEGVIKGYCLQGKLDVSKQLR